MLPLRWTGATPLIDAAVRWASGAPTCFAANVARERTSYNPALRAVGMNAELVADLADGLTAPVDLADAVMDHSTGVTSIDLLVGLTPWLWVTSLVFFGLGDLLTTVVGLQTRMVVEVSPLVAEAVSVHGLGVLPSLKLAAFGLCFLLWKVVPRPHNVGVPLALAVIGVGVTLWNLVVLSMSLPAPVVP